MVEKFMVVGRKEYNKDSQNNTGRCYSFHKGASNKHILSQKSESSWILEENA